MQTPIQIALENIEEASTARASIERLVAGLERRFGRITACRVSLKGPSSRHKTGGLYEVRIHLTLPNGGEVNVDRTPTSDERHADLAFAINDAFKHARRCLQDKARLMQGLVKSHADQPIGTIAKIDGSGDFGFLSAPDGHEVYFHRNSVLNDDFKKLTIGSRVAFVEEIGIKGPQASTVRLLGKHSMR